MREISVKRPDREELKLLTPMKDIAEIHFSEDTINPEASGLWLYFGVKNNDLEFTKREDRSDTIITVEFDRTDHRHIKLTKGVILIDNCEQHNLDYCEEIYSLEFHYPSPIGYQQRQKALEDVGLW